MANIIACVNFYGHNDPGVAGIPLGCVPISRGFYKATKRYLKLTYASNIVGESRLSGLQSPKGTLRFFDYNAALNETGNSDLAKTILQKVAESMVESGDGPVLAYLITGFSAGGVSAIHLGRVLTQKMETIWYIGLADPAFQRGESDYLMKHSGVTARYSKNYYQTKQNSSDEEEIHDQVQDFKTNIDLTNRLANDEDDPHKAAVKMGNDLMFNDIKWCLENC